MKKIKNEGKDFYSELDQIVDTEEFLESVKEGFRDVEDPRVQDNQSYPLASLFVIILCSILAGANSIVQIHMYACVKLEMFRRILGLNRAPSYNVFWWLLTRLDPRQIEKSFVRWIQALSPDTRDKIISVDGKHLRGASSESKVYMVSAWGSLQCLLLGQTKTNEKSNEITAIPELLESMDIRGSTITIDAAGC